MNIFVTGAGGFIGSHLVESLLSDGHFVTAFVRYTSRGSAGYLDDIPSEFYEQLTVERGDIRNMSDVYSAWHNSNYIIHLAAQIAIPYSYVAPHEFVDTNIMGTLNMLKMAKDTDSRMICFSTSETYGTAQSIPMTELHPQVAQSPYSATKIGAEKLCESFYRSFGTKVVVVRPFNTFGPRQSNRAVIPSIILQALNGATEIGLGSLEASRDFNYVYDMVRYITKIIESDCGVGHVFNLASGEDYTLADIVKKVGILLGKEITPIIDQKRVRPVNSEVMRLQGDASLARKTFRLDDPIDIMEGLKQTIKYFRDHIKAERFTL